MEEHDDSPARVALFTLALIPCIALLVVSGFNVYRQHYFSTDKIKRFYWIRWAVVVCCFQQLLVFIGYLSENVILGQFAWNTWIPTALFCLTILSIRLSESYIQIRCIAFSINKKHIYIAYGSWAIASIFNWTGSLCGWAFAAKIPQAFFYATWKVLAAICLSVVSWIVLQVRNATKNVYKHQLRRESLDVRFKPKSSNFKEDIIDGAKSIKLAAQNSFNESMEKLSSKKLEKQNSTSISQSIDGLSNGERNTFEAPDCNAPPTLNDDDMNDNSDQEHNDMVITTPKRVPEPKMGRQLTLDANGNIITKISEDMMTMNEKQLFKLAHSLKRMRNLLICLIILVLVLISDAITQYVYFHEISHNPSHINKYAHPSIVQVVILYLSIWSFVQSILLIYTWIPSKQYKLQLERHRRTLQREANNHRNGGDVSLKTMTDDSSRTIPM